MELLDRTDEMRRLSRLANSPDGGLAVIYGRRRIGKSRLLSEWSSAFNGIHFIADQSSESIQLRFFASECARVFPGFDQVEYPGWTVLLKKLSEEALRHKWRGPLVIDELPYLAVSSPAIASILQRWVDTDAKKAGLVTAVCGSSQRMMQGLVLDSDAPLYGRAVENIRLRELPPFWLLKAFKWLDETDAVRLYSVVGGIPYYWELVKASGIKSIDDIADQLLIDPHGPLHDEPQRLLLEESPPAAALRPVLDAIGGGAHRLSEIAGRIGQPSTALGHPIKRLIEIGLIKRDLPFNESEKNSKRTLYSIADPFCRIWFSIIAPHRGALLNLPKPARIALFKQASARLYSETWEELCRNAVPCISDIKETVTEGIMWGEAKRWWHGEEPEWDIVAESINGKYLLLGEAKWGVSDANFIRKAVEGVSVRKLPNVKNIDKYDIIRAVFVPRRPTGFKPAKNVSVLDAGDILRCMENSKASGV